LQINGNIPNFAQTIKNIKQTIKNKKLMKKIFTLLTMALLAVGASAQKTTNTITFGTKASPATLASTFSDGQFVLTRTDTNNKHAIDANNAYFGDADSQVKFETRLKSGGKSSSSNSMMLTIPSDGTLRVYVRSASSSDASRTLVLKQNDLELYKKVVKDADAISVNMEENISTENPTGATNVFPVVSVEVKKGTVEITYPQNGINFYAFELEYEGTVEAVEPVFALTKSEIYADETSKIVVSGKSDLDGLTLNDVEYDNSVITIDEETGVITPVAVGTSTITFTTGALDGVYKAGSASLSITVKEIPAAPEFGQWNFSDEAFSRYSSITENVTVAGLTIHASSSKSLAIDQNEKSIDGYDFTYRLKLNGEGSEDGRYLSFEVSGPCTINVYGMSANKDATDRNLIVTSGSLDGDKLYNEEIKGDKIYKVSVDYTGTDATTIYVYSNNSINLYGIFVITPLDPTEATVWDFTQELSAADASNLEADDTWTFDNEKNYWKNSESLVTGRNVYTALEANGEELEIAKGLTFARDNNEGIAAERIMIAPAKYLAVNGSSMLINLGKLAKDDVVRMRIKGAGDSERSLTPTENIEVAEGSLTTADTDVHEVELKVLEDGFVTFKTTNGFQFLAIAINDELPEYTGISVINAETEGTADAPVYNLSGQRVDENYRGVVIKNGKKMIK